MRTLALAVLLVGFAVRADPPSAEQMAKLQHDIQQATDAVDKKYEGKELSPEEKKQQIKDRAAAENGVLDKAGVDKKDFARASAKMSKDDRATVASEKEKLDKKDKAGDGAAKGGSKEIVVEKGGQGAPKSDEEQAAEMDKQSGYGKGSGKKSSKKH